MRVEALKQFCEKIGLYSDTIKEKETTEKLVLTEDLTAERVKKLSAGDFNNLVENFSESLAVSIKHSAGIKLLSIVEGKPDKQISDAISKIADESDESDLNIEITIDKAKLLQSIEGIKVEQTLFYFFKENLLKIFNSSPSKIDELIFNSKQDFRLILVSEECPQFKDGFLLSVINEKDISSFDSSKFILSSEKLDRLANFDSHQSKRSWLGIELNNLTPLHFLGKWEGNEKAEFEESFNRLLQKLCVIHTANSIIYNKDNDTTKATYANLEREVRLELSNSVQTQSNENLSKIINWISEGNFKDKLNIFQNVTARTLDIESSEKNYKSFTESLPVIFDNAQWNYRLYLDGKINKHFDEVQKFSSSISEIAGNISDKIDTITKGFTDTLLATIGVLIASVLAALVQKNVSADLFYISFIAYAFYLIFFTLYRMGSIYYSYDLFKKDLNELITNYGYMFSKEKIDSILKPVKRRQRQFRISFWSTLVIYLVLIIGVWFAAVNLPNYLIEKGLIKIAASTDSDKKDEKQAESQTEDSNTSDTKTK